MASAIATRFNVQSISAISAQVLAVAFAFSIPLANSLTIVLSVLLAFTCIMQMDGNSWSQVLKHPVTIAILILISLSLVDMVHSVAAPREITQALRKITRLLYFPLLLPIFFHSQWRHSAIIAFCCALLLSVVVAMHAGGVIFKDTIFTSLFVAFAIFMLAHYSFVYKNYRWLTTPLAVFFTYYLLFVCFGRTGQVLFIMLFMLFSWQRFPHTFKHQSLSALLLCMIIAASVWAPSSFIDRQLKAMVEVTQIMHTEEIDIPYESSMGTRFVLAHNAWELIKSKPFLGWGTGSFKAVYAKYAPEAQVKDVQRANPHNQYLLTWVELGLPGFIALLYLFFTLARSFLTQPKGQLEGYLGFGLLCAMLLGCCINSWLLDFTSAFFFVFFAALFAGAYTPKDSKNI